MSRGVTDLEGESRGREGARSAVVGLLIFGGAPFTKAPPCAEKSGRHLSLTDGKEKGGSSDLRQRRG